MVLDSRTLEMFVVLADELHFGRTGAALGIAQSAVSKQLLRLEDRIGTRLIDRDRRKAVQLTPAGITFLQEARRALAGLARAEHVGRLAGRAAAGELSLGYVLSAAVSGVLPRALARLRQGLPDVVVTTEPMETPTQIAAIAGGRLGIGIVRPRSIVPDGVEMVSIHREPMILALPDRHPLARHASIEPQLLGDDRFVVPQFGEASGLADTVRRLATLGEFRLRPFVDTRDYITAICIVASGAGVSLVPASMARLAIDGVRYRPIAGHTDVVDLALVWRSGSVAPAIRLLVDAFTNPERAKANSGSATWRAS